MDKNKIFLKYVEFEAWRQRGTSWIAVLYGWLSINTLKDAFLVGGIAKLTLFKMLPMWTFLLIVFILGFLFEFLKAFIGWIDFKYGMWEKQNEWGSKHQKNNPFNCELVAQLKEHTKALEELTKREIPNHFKDL